MLLKIIILTVGLLHQQTLFANPTPINLELSKATLQDVKKDYKILMQKPTNFGAVEYSLDINNINIQQLKYASVLCDENNIVQGVQLIINKNRFEDIYQSLNGKYKLVNKDIPFVGNKTVTFSDDDSYITVIASHLNFDMSLTYLTLSMSQKISEANSKVDAEKKSKEEKMF